MQITIVVQDLRPKRDIFTAVFTDVFTAVKRHRK